MQEAQSLGHHLICEKINACRVTARPGEAGDKTKLNRVFAYTEDDRDACCRSFGRERECGARRGDHCHLSTHQASQQCWQAIVLTLQPVVLAPPVPASAVAGFVETFTKRGRIPRVGLGRPVSDKPTHRHRLLLRARRERPRRRTADQSDELAPLHHSITSSARASRVAGTSRPSVLAVLRLMTSSNLVGCWTGMSAGFDPRSILSTSSALHWSRF